MNTTVENHQPKLETKPKQLATTKPPAKLSALQAGLITLAILAVGTVAVFFAIYQIALRSAKGPAEEAVKFVAAVQAKDISTAYDLTAPTFKHEVNEADFTQILTLQNAELNKGKITVASQKNKTSDGHQSSTVGLNIGEGNESMNATVQLTKINNQWLIANIGFGKGYFTGSTLDNSQ